MLVTPHFSQGFPFPLNQMKNQLYHPNSRWQVPLLVQINILRRLKQKIEGIWRKTEIRLQVFALPDDCLKPKHACSFHHFCNIFFNGLP